MDELTKNEELILLSILKLQGNAYLVTIRKGISDLSGKAINYGSLCNTLSALIRKGYLHSRESTPLARQGGRRKVLYSLTKEGEDALKHAYEIHKSVWNGFNDLLPGVK